MKVFVSYGRADEAAAQRIWALLQANNVPAYLDVADPELQAAVSRKDDHNVVLSLERALGDCTHLLTLVSNSTKGSWWVPWESGAARQVPVTAALVVLKQVDELPSYLKILDRLTTKSELFQWLRRAIGKDDLFEEIRKAANLDRLEDYVPVSRHQPIRFG